MAGQLCPQFVLFWGFFSTFSHGAELYLGSDERVQPLSCLGVPNDAVHAVDVEHDLSQRWGWGGGGNNNTTMLRRTEQIQQGSSTALTAAAV